MISQNSPFASGTQFALIEHLSDENRVHQYSRLERFSNEFIRILGSWWTTEYKWPKDPIRNWSRIWEYPFVSCLAEKLVKNGSKVLDVGSGTTFFPFYLAQINNFDLYALDNDPKHNSHFSACCRAVRQKLKLHDLIPVPVMASAECTRLKSDSFDLVYSISVLEHVPDPLLVIEEIYRLLKPGGYLIVTLDVAYPLGVKSDGLQVPDLIELTDTVSNKFLTLIPPIQPFPQGLLTYENSPNRNYKEPDLPWSALLRPIGKAPGSIYWRLRQVMFAGFKKDVTSPIWEPHLCIFGLVAQKPF